MKSMKQLYPAMLGVSFATAVLLMIPLIAMQFDTGVNWTASDFIVAGAILFVTGTCFVLITMLGGNVIYRLAFILALGSSFLLVWANLAVGLIGGGPNIGNFLYLGVLAVAVIGTLRSHYKPAGMEKAMYATAGALVILAIIALLTGMYEYPGSSVREIIGVNGFFAALFATSGLLFRFVTRGPSMEPNHGG